MKIATVRLRSSLTLTTSLIVLVMCAPATARSGNLVVAEQVHWSSLRGFEPVEAFLTTLESCVEMIPAVRAASAASERVDDATYTSVLASLSPTSPCLTALRQVLWDADEANIETDGSGANSDDGYMQLLVALAQTTTGQELIDAARFEGRQRANRALADFVAGLVNPSGESIVRAVDTDATVKPELRLTETFALALRGDAAAIQDVLRLHYDHLSSTGGFTIRTQWDFSRPLVAGVSGHLPDDGITGKFVVGLAYAHHEQVETLLKEAENSTNQTVALNALESLLELEPLSDAQRTAIAALNDQRPWFREGAWKLRQFAIRPGTPSMPSTAYDYYRINLTKEQRASLKKSPWPDVRRSAWESFP